MTKLRARPLPKQSKLKQRDFSKPFWVNCPLMQCPYCGRLLASRLLVMSTQTFSLRSSTPTDRDGTTDTSTDAPTQAPTSRGTKGSVNGDDGRKAEP